VGSLNETTVLKHLHDGLNMQKQTINAVMGKPFPEVAPSTEVSEAYRILLAGHNAIVLSENGKAKSIMTKMDIINYYVNAGRIAG
jgi:predicted transcriptional regulator